MHGHNHHFCQIDMAKRSYTIQTYKLSFIVSRIFVQGIWFFRSAHIDTFGHRCPTCMLVWVCVCVWFPFLPIFSLTHLRSFSLSRSTFRIIRANQQTPKKRKTNGLLAGFVLCRLPFLVGQLDIWYPQLYQHVAHRMPTHTHTHKKSSNHCRVIEMGKYESWHME